MTEQEFNRPSEQAGNWLTRVKLGHSSVLVVISTIIILLPAALIVWGSELAHQRTVEYFTTQMKEKAKLAASLIDPYELAKLQEAGDTDNSTYRQLIEPLVVFFQTRQDVRCVHSFRTTEGNGLEYVLDVNTQLDRLGIPRKLPPSLIGDRFEGEQQIADSIIQLSSKRETVIFDEPVTDEFGTFLGACSPVPNAESPEQQIICVDFTLDGLNLQLKEITDLRNLALILSLLLSGSLGLILWSDRVALARANQRLIEISRSDSLTGVCNRRSFFQHMHNEMSRVKRHDIRSGLLLLDIDHFKSINDSYGHATGDEVLVALTKSLKNSLRPNDIIGRLGGEEFGILVPDSDLEKSTTLAERIRQSVEQLRVTDRDNKSINLTVSIGVNEFSRDSDSVKNALASTDDRLYAAKAKGRNLVISDDS